MKMPKDSIQTPGAQDKASVNYRMGDPRGERCETCTNFRPEQEACTVVQGTINPAGMCDRYAGMGKGEEGAEMVDDPNSRQAAMEQMLFGGGPGMGGPV